MAALSSATAANGHTYLYAVHSGYPGDRGDYQGSKKATPVRLTRVARVSGRNPIIVGGQPRWAQAPFWPSCSRCGDKSFFVATLYQFDLPPGAEGRGNTLNVFVCGRCRTQSMVRQST